MLTCVIRLISCNEGKTALCSTILNEMVTLRGGVAVEGSVAYVPQIPCLSKLTMQENILFGRMYEQERYDSAVQACQLERTFSQIAGGDMAQTSECVLTREQQMRILVARALYAQADTLVLDDPFAAMDAQAAATLLQTIQSFGTAATSIVLSTTQPFLLQCATEIVVLNAGFVAERGTYDALMNGARRSTRNTSRSNISQASAANSVTAYSIATTTAVSMRTEFAEMVARTTLNANLREDQLGTDNLSTLPADSDDEAGNVGNSVFVSTVNTGRRSTSTSPFKRAHRRGPAFGFDELNTSRLLFGTEEVLQTESRTFVTGSGTTPLHVYTTYMKSGGSGSVTKFVLLTLCFLGSEALFLGKDIWLAEWSVQSFAQNATNASAQTAASLTGTLEEARLTPSASAPLLRLFKGDVFGPSNNGATAAAAGLLDSQPTNYFVGVYCGIAAGYILFVVLRTFLLVRQNTTTPPAFSSLLRTLMGCHDLRP